MRKVLIVEPKAADARALRERLREAGMGDGSTLVKSVADARQHLAEGDQTAVVMLNIHTPDGDGMEFLDWLQAQSYYGDLLVVAIGERSQLRTVVEACERGAHTFLIKPVHMDDIKTLADRYPAHWTPARE
jgi:DNA-binding NtrC family response regulator